MEPFKLDKFQEQAIAASRANKSIIVSAPTGAGKTLIAEEIIADAIKNKKGVIYTAPIKALSNQKYRDFSLKYPDQVGILTGDVTINRDAPVLIMTTEIFRNAILVNPEEFQRREWVIFDEIHYLDDIERGTVWEEAIILIPPQMRILALSATISNLKEFTGWIEKVHSWPLEVVIEKNRPVPLHFAFQCSNEIFDNFSLLKKSQHLHRKLERPSYQERYFFSKPNRIKTLIEAIAERKALPAIYFSFSRRRSEELAQEVGYFNLLSPEEKNKITAMFDQLVKKFNISSSPHINFLIPLIKKGIAYHHAGLLPTLKEVVERLFATGLIKLIFTTETFALGINMPAKTVIFDTLSKFYGRYHGYLKVRDFYQMAGRAGRRGIDQEGFVFSRVNPSHIDSQNLEKIIYGNYEPIKSQLNSCYATILNLYKLMGERIYEIYPKSFHFSHGRPWEKKETLGLFKRKIELLKNIGYIQENGLSQKGELAARVYSFELNIGEMFAHSYMDQLSAEDLFIMITALVYEPRKGENRPKMSKKIKDLKRDIDKFMKDIHKEERYFRIYPMSKNFFFHLGETCRMWFAGQNFLSLHRFCQVDEGELVRYLRMSVQVLREIHSSGTINPSLQSKIRQCLEAVNRDAVDAEKQLRQEI